MTSKAREFIDFWIENSVHAREHFGMAGSEQGIPELVRRLLEAAQAQGVSEKAMTAEVGALTEYIRGKLASANEAESGRTDRHKNPS